MARFGGDSQALTLGVMLVAVVALVFAMADVALARVDALGGDTFSLAYAPYTAGPVVQETVIAPYAPYTAGPVVPQSRIEPYAPYVAGPVIHDSDLLPYAP